MLKQFIVTLSSTLNGVPCEGVVLSPFTVAAEEGSRQGGGGTASRAGARGKGSGGECWQVSSRIIEQAQANVSEYEGIRAKALSSSPPPPSALSAAPPAPAAESLFMRQIRDANSDGATLPEHYCQPGGPDVIAPWTIIR